MHIKTLAGTTTTIAASVCPRCGTIGKSGKPSCCGRGGSWFKNCGSSGKTKLQHTWYEGIQGCKARSQAKTAVGHQRNAAQQKDIDSSPGDSMKNYRSVIVATKTFVFKSVNTSTPMSDTTVIVTSTYTPKNMSNTVTSHILTTNTITSILMTSSSTHTSVSTPVITQGCVNLLKVIVHINVLCIIIF